jgi:hypothetical protein
MWTSDERAVRDAKGGMAGHRKEPEPLGEVVTPAQPSGERMIVDVLPRDWPVQTFDAFQSGGASLRSVLRPALVTKSEEAPAGTQEAR